MRENITYKPEPFGGLVDEWQTPKETIQLKTGDCEDFSILWLFLVYNVTGEKGELVISQLPTGQFHASARLRNQVFYEIRNQKELWYFSYDDAIVGSEVRSIKGGIK
jgi:hypothetical protein